MKLYQLRSKQSLKVSKITAWNFLSNPKNLKNITPEYMNFEILNGADKSIYPGQIIQYSVQPFPGFHTKWVTEITHVVEEKYFVDEQRFGPYSLWHHKHFIKEVNGGIEMEDIVDYKLPFGVLGQLANSIYIKKQLRSIFKYREKKLRELFGEINSYENKLEIISV